MSTASLEGARDHARSQAGARAATQRTVPSDAATDLPAGVEPALVLWDETVGVGNYATGGGSSGHRGAHRRRRGRRVVHLLLHNRRAPDERVNVADTVKVQWQAYLGEGAVILSDMGRAMMTITTDTSSGHDALCGSAGAAVHRRRYGSSGIHTATPTVGELLTVAAAKHGLDRRDLPTGINLFKAAVVDADGSLHLRRSAAPGATVELRAEMDVVVMLANVPHPLDDRAAYTSSTVRVTAWRGVRTGPDDPQWVSSQERQRAYENTDDLLRTMA